jgi:dTDP-4-dehydrorhamnose 3,5-epimerase
MRFTETRLPGAFIIDLERREDQRGFFARVFCRREFEEHGLKGAFVQCHTSFNHVRGTLRGMHYQEPPAAETKIVRCTHGAIYDVIVDLRPESPTYLQHIAVELNAENRRQLYVPELFAHGFVTLADNTEVAYQVGEFYAPAYERGRRYDDPVLSISWPVPIEVIAEKDLRWPLLNSPPDDQGHATGSYPRS